VGVSNPDGKYTADRGDSGAIVFRYSGGKYYNIGILSAGDNSTNKSGYMMTKIGDVIKYYSDSTYSFVVKDNDPKVKVAD
jgi:hypothetical protein